MTTPSLAELAASTAGPEQVALRRDLVRAGVPRWFLRNELRRRRWQRGGPQTLVLHNGPLTVEQRWWVAVLDTGAAAALDGTTALQAAGLKGLTDTEICVSTPRGSTPAKPRGVRVRETRRFRAEDVDRSGVPRMQPATAAVHAALWAKTDRQAQLFITMTVQQRLATVDQVREVLERVRRHARRRLLRQLLVSLAEGAESLNELDVAVALRRRGLPEPVRQSVRRRPSGSWYLDAEFPEYDLALEVDGKGHDDPTQRLKDLVRDLGLLAAGDSTIRIPVVAWRLDEEAVLDGLEAVFRARGWVAQAA